MLDERRDRPVSMLAAQESQQHTIAANFNPCQALSPTGEIQAQKSRERNGNTLLQCEVQSATANLNLYCKKTKVALEEVARKEGSGWSVKLVYKSVTRTVTANGKGQNKKSAKKQAAHSLLNAIKYSVDHT